MTLRSLFLFTSLLLCAGPGWADTALPAAGKVTQSTWAQVGSGKVQELLVEFRDPAIASEVQGELKRRHLSHADAGVLQLKSDRYGQLKRRNLEALNAGDVQVQREFSHLPMSFVRVRDQAALARLLARPEVVMVSEPHQALPQSLDLDLIGQPQTAQLLNQTGAGTTVAVLDTGVDYTTSTFGSCTAPGVPAATCKVVAALDTGTNDGALDNYGHGTIVAATVLSAAPGAKIAALDVCDPVNGCNNVTIIAGIDWAIANKATYNIVAINISLEDSSFNTSPCAATTLTDPSWGMQTTVQNALNAGILTVIASGNGGSATGIGWPACVPGVVSVGAVYDGSGCTAGVPGGVVDGVACFSNVSSYLSLLTPAGATSFAAPLAAAAVAVLAAAYPAETPALRKTRMTATGKPVKDTRSNGLGTVVPRLDMVAALLYPGNAAPGNDNFAAATGLSGSTGTALGWNDSASKEIGEPLHAGIAGGHTVWWQWTPTESGTVTLNTHGSNFDTLLAVYTGNAVAALSSVASNDDDGTAAGNSGLSFHADAGVSYHIAIDGKAGVQGDLYLNRSFSADPAATVNLSVGVTANPNPASVGSFLTYSLSVRNSGPATATNVTLSQILPGTVSFVSADSGCSLSGSTVSCALGSLSAGTTVSRNVQVLVNAAGTLASSVQVSTSSSDAYVADNSASNSVTASLPVNADVPMPAWSLALLGSGLWAAMRRRR